jgi:hypothetical protein
MIAAPGPRWGYGLTAAFNGMHYSIKQWPLRSLFLMLLKGITFFVGE